MATAEAKAQTTSMDDAANENQNNTQMMEETVSFFQENSTMKSNGVRDVNKKSYLDMMGKHGVTRQDIEKVQSASDFINTAAARVAVGDLENKISEMSKDDLGDDEKRRGLSATVRLPTMGGSTEVTVNAETYSPIPSRPDADGNVGERQYKTTHGRLRTSINTKSRIHPDFHQEASDRMRKALNIKD